MRNLGLLWTVAAVEKVEYVKVAKRARAVAGRTFTVHIIVGQGRQEVRRR